MNHKQLQLEIQSMPSGDFIVSDMTPMRALGPGVGAQQIYACTSIDEALQFVRMAMLGEDHINTGPSVTGCKSFSVSGATVTS
jgi:hypothetical protein